MEVVFVPYLKIFGPCTHKVVAKLILKTMHAGIILGAAKCMPCTAIVAQCGHEMKFLCMEGPGCLSIVSTNAC